MKEVPQILQDRETIPTSQRPHFAEVGHTKTRFKKGKDQVCWIFGLVGYDAKHFQCDLWNRQCLAVSDDFPPPENVSIGRRTCHEEHSVFANCISACHVNIFRLPELVEGTRIGNNHGYMDDMALG